MAESRSIRIAWRTGYGSVDALFSAANVVPNAGRYGEWILDAQTPVIAARVGRTVSVVPFPARRGQPGAFAWMGLAFVLRRPRVLSPLYRVRRVVVHTFSAAGVAHGAGARLRSLRGAPRPACGAAGDPRAAALARSWPSTWRTRDRTTRSPCVTSSVGSSRPARGWAASWRTMLSSSLSSKVGASDITAGARRRSGTPFPRRARRGGHRVRTCGPTARFPAGRLGGARVPRTLCGSARGAGLASRRRAPRARRHRALYDPRDRRR